MRLREDGILWDLEPHEAAMLAEARKEMRFHIENMLALIEAQAGNAFLSDAYATAAAEVMLEYASSIRWARNRAEVSADRLSALNRPDFTGAVGYKMRRIPFCIDEDVLPKGKVRGSVTSRGEETLTFGLDVAAEKVTVGS